MVTSKWDFLELQLSILLNSKPSDLEECITSISTQQQRKGQYIQEVLSVVSFILHSDPQNTLSKSLEVLDRGVGLRHLVCTPSGREVVLAPAGKPGQPGYLCLNRPPRPEAPVEERGAEERNRRPVPYCSCRAFLEQAKHSQEKVLCKHLLAILLAPLLCPESIIKETVSDEDLHRYTCEI
mmetsp:Transcript_18873/g.24882  ORF Transcript_18873/g.24882 Transcript_18873/m.24882 type:complete len:181 (+) Transcript_18873:17-559(+)